MEPGTEPKPRDKRTGRRGRGKSTPRVKVEDQIVPARVPPHAASKQSVLALIAAGFGVTLATASEAEVVFPGVVYRPIRDDNAWVQVELVWCPQADDPPIGRFVAFMRDEALSRRLF